MQRMTEVSSTRHVVVACDEAFKGSLVGAFANDHSESSVYSKNPKQIPMIKIQKSKQVITPSLPSPLEGEGEGGGEFLCRI